MSVFEVRPEVGFSGSQDKRYGWAAPERLPSDGLGRLNCLHPGPWGAHEAARFYRASSRFGRDVVDGSAGPAN
jgi:hypothetical protein